MPPQQESDAQAAAVQKFHQMLGLMVGAGERVSDLFFSPGNPPLVELLGSLTPVNLPGLDKLTAGHTAAISRMLMAGNKQAAEDLELKGAADLSYGVPGLARFRVNVFKQRCTHAVVMRVITENAPSFAQLGLPAELRNIAELKNGIVLVTGATGSGKSSTLAAVIDLINETKPYHIITIEDPIEYLHPHKRSAVHQRELHTDTPSFALALRAALRQAPKVILVGEIRDRETVEMALEAAETGHLVLSTLHTINASKTVERLIGLFPKNEEPVVRTRVAGTFRYVVSQRLIPRADGKGRVAALEILKSTARTRDYVEKGESEGKSLEDAMRAGREEGMQTFDGVIEGMIREGVISLERGLAYATNANNLRVQLADMA
ncbi:MAG TPA: PilT/PilU family type 4a pilus ATPase [Pyrinomonadaceae bacterium]